MLAAQHIVRRFGTDECEQEDTLARNNLLFSQRRVKKTAAFG
jgi:hypothetical protein